MLLFLFLLSNPFVTVIADRNETKGIWAINNLTNTTDYYKSSQKDKQSELIVYKNMFLL